MHERPPAPLMRKSGEMIAEFLDDDLEKIYMDYMQEMVSAG